MGDIVSIFIGYSNISNCLIKNHVETESLPHIRITSK
jgi:hypothetical protein